MMPCLMFVTVSDRLAGRKCTSGPWPVPGREQRERTEAHLAVPDGVLAAVLVTIAAIACLQHGESQV